MYFKCFDSETSTNMYFSKGTKTCYLNPDNLTNLHKQSIQIQPKWLDGFHIECKKGIDTNKTVFSDCNLSKNNLSGVRIGLNYSQANESNNSVLESPFVSADINPYNLSSNFTVMHHILPSVRLKFKNHFLFPYKSGEGTTFLDAINKVIFAESAFSCDWFENSQTLSFLTTKFNNEFVASNLSYMRCISPNWTVGSELSCLWKNSAEEKLNFETSLAARYASQEFTVAASTCLNPFKLDFTYFYPYSDKIKLGTSLIINSDVGQAIAAAYFQYDLYDAIVRAKVETNGIVGLTYERMFSDLNLIGSLLMNAKTQKMMCGIKISASL